MQVIEQEGMQLSMVKGKTLLLEGASDGGGEFGDLGHLLNVMYSNDLRAGGGGAGDRGGGAEDAVGGIGDIEDVAYEGFTAGADE